MIKNEFILINGDGETNRDFGHIANAKQIYLLAATAAPEAVNHVYNVPVGDRTTLKELFEGSSF